MPRTEPEPPPATVRKRLVTIEGVGLEVPEGTPVAYLARVYDLIHHGPTHVHLTTDREVAWAFVRKSIQTNLDSFGGVHAYNVMQEEPKFIRDLGRIDKPTQDPVLP